MPVSLWFKKCFQSVTIMFWVDENMIYTVVKPDEEWLKNCVKRKHVRSIRLSPWEKNRNGSVVLVQVSTVFFLASLPTVFLNKLIIKLAGITNVLLKCWYIFISLFEHHESTFEFMNINFHGLIHDFIFASCPHISGPGLELPLMSNGALPWGRELKGCSNRTRICPTGNE